MAGKIHDGARSRRATESPPSQTFGRSDVWRTLTDRIRPMSPRATVRRMAGAYLRRAGGG